MSVSVYDVAARRAALEALRARAAVAHRDPNVPEPVLALICDLALELRRCVVALETRPSDRQA